MLKIEIESLKRANGMEVYFFLICWYNFLFCFLVLLHVLLLCFEWNSWCNACRYLRPTQISFAVVIFKYWSFHTVSFNLLCDECCTLEVLSVLDKRTRQIMNSPPARLSHSLSRSLTPIHSSFISLTHTHTLYLTLSRSFHSLCHSFTYNFMFT